MADCRQTPGARSDFVYDIPPAKLMNDVQIRTALKRELLLQYKDDRETVVIEELGVHHGTSRIDLAVVNGVLHGFEFKSDRDTLTRLPEQANAYGLVFDRLTLVVAERHVRRAVERRARLVGDKSHTRRIRRLIFL